MTQKMTSGARTVEPDVVVSTPPFVHDRTSTPRIMREVLLLALLVLALSVWFFGIGALLVTVAASAGAVATEWLFNRGVKPTPLRDYTALLTGVLIALTLPPGFPLWMAFLGGGVGVGLGKLVWGGLGQNLFNPALVGRAFLQAAFPTAITTWAPLAEDRWSIPAGQLAAPLFKSSADIVTTATPLGLMKFEGAMTELGPLAFGSTAGSIGETSALLLVVIGVYMAWRRLFDWRLAVSTIVGVAAFSGILWGISPDSYPDPLFMVTSGGLLFAAVFMVTDPVTTPTTPKGAWIFGIGTAFLVVLIRLFGGLPEGVMYAVLLMNALTPHINRYTQPRPFGTPKRRTRDGE
ncbi:MAG: RnfABCDGE type electron transport complex subunit D [Myxococcota bacterium]